MERYTRRTLKIYGPYKRKDGRLHICVEVNGRKTSISYPKYLVEKHLGRKLLPNETVDHIDNNPLNNKLSNLRIFDRSEHASQDSKRLVEVKIKCIWCKKKMTLNSTQINNRSRKDKEVAGPFCSKHCSGQYGASVQKNKNNKLPKAKELKKNTTKLKLEPINGNVNSGSGDNGKSFSNGNTVGTKKLERRRD